MLPVPAVPPSLMALLKKLGTFTSPSRRTFAALLAGLVAATGKRTVTGILTAAGLSRAWSHDRAHAFFSRAAWNPEVLGLALSHLLVTALLPDGGALTPAVDDTLFKRYGKKVFGAGWQHDGAAKGPHPVGRGTCFVVLGLIMELPMLSRPVCLPVMARLWRPKTGPSKTELAASMNPAAGRVPSRTGRARRGGRRLPRQGTARAARQRHVHHPAARELLRVAQARNRTENAVRRTVPFGLYVYSITVLWLGLSQPRPGRLTRPERRKSSGLGALVSVRQWNLHTAGEARTRRRSSRR